MSEFGRVCTGYSRPWVANYAANAGVVTYSNAIRAGRGVSIKVNPTSADDNKFYADNQVAESADGVFTGGTADIVIDGMFKPAGHTMFGWPEADGSGWTHEGDSAVAPYCGFGFVARFMSGGVTTYVPYIIRKGKFSIPATEANTQGESIDWQTQSLSMSLMRDDTANHDWRWIGAEYSTEDAAEAAIKTVFNVSSEAFGLTALTIGSLTLSPTFATGTYEYTTSTTNASNAVTATATSGAKVVVTVNGDSLTNGGSATWAEGENEVNVLVKKGDFTKLYTVTVTKS